MMRIGMKRKEVKLDFCSQYAVSNVCMKIILQLLKIILKAQPLNFSKLFSHPKRMIIELGIVSAQLIRKSV